MNGQVERDMQSVLNKARTFMSSYEVKERYWEYAIRMAVWYINRYPTAKNDNITPYQLVYNVVPDMSKAIPFYCPGVYHISKSERQKSNKNFANKAGLCRMLDYDDDSKMSVIILDIETNKIITRSDCIFDRTLVETYYKNGKYDYIIENDITTIHKPIEVSSEYAYNKAIDTITNEYRPLEINDNEESNSTIVTDDSDYDITSDNYDDYVHNVMNDNKNNINIDTNSIRPLTKTPKTLKEALSNDNPNKTEWWMATEK
jgi:hypothetical protein